MDVGNAVRPTNSVDKPHILKSLLKPVLIFEYHSASRLVWSNVRGAVGGTDATGTLSPETVSVLNREPGKRSVTQGGGGFTGIVTLGGGDAADEVSPILGSEVSLMSDAGAEPVLSFFVGGGLASGVVRSIIFSSFLRLAAFADATLDSHPMY